MTRLARDCNCLSRLSGDRTSSASEVGIRRHPEGTVATTRNYRREKCSGGGKDAVLQRGGRLAKQMLLHETERARYAMLHQIADGFFGMMSTVASRHEI
jgi:hypothetical protein